MPTVRVLILAAVLAVPCLSAAPLAAAEVTESLWETNQGPLTLRRAGRKVTGVFPKYKGRLAGLMQRDGSFLGLWIQPTSQKRCARAKSGSHYWGSLRLRGLDGKRFSGDWAYCDDRAGSGGSWTGTRVRSRAVPRQPTRKPGATSGAEAGDGSKPFVSSGLASEMLTAVNAERRKRGLTPLKLNASLSRAAQAHAEDMARSGKLSHTGSDGSGIGDRAKRVDYRFRRLAENIAGGQRTVPRVMDSWMTSPGHKANILTPELRELGVGRAGRYWVQFFGAR